MVWEIDHSVLEKPAVFYFMSQKAAGFYRTLALTYKTI
jgi:hypothetical protein